MGMLIDGVWTDGEILQEASEMGRFKRSDSQFRSFITADGSSGFKAETGRYHLYAAHGCPWAHRALIYHALKNLSGVISVSLAISGPKTEGWSYGEDQRFPDCTPDLVNGYRYLRDAYTATDGKYTGKVTVPALWDRKSGRIINNESSEIIRMLNSEFNQITGEYTDYYPAYLRAEIDAINDKIYHAVNNGVYRCGFAASQEAYEEAFDTLFDTLDELERRLSRQRFLVGGHLTEADWRLFPTLVRFDVVYFSAFKCNKKRLADYPNLFSYMRELYHVPGIAATVKPRHYILNYYSIPKANPNGIIPKGTPFDMSAPPDRVRQLG